MIDDPDEFARRLPLMAAKRDFSEPVALNWAADGTDIDFGALSRQLIGYCVRNGATALFGHEVRNLSRQSDGSWTLTIANRRTGEKRKLKTKFVFVGAGGDALPLLQKSGIREVKGFAGFPIGGRFLRTGDPALTAAAPGQGVRRPGAGGPAARGAAPGSAVRQRQIVAGFRSLRRLVTEVLETRPLHRSAPIGQAR